MTEKQLLSKAMGVLGSKSSPRKARSSSSNGKKGGRPRIKKGLAETQRLGTFVHQ